MDKIFSCIDGYLEDLQSDMMEIVANQKIPLERKNMLMLPIAEQKKVLVRAKKELEVIRDRVYTEGCGMSKLREENDDK